MEDAMTTNRNLPTPLVPKPDPTDSWVSTDIVAPTIEPRTLSRKTLKWLAKTGRTLRDGAYLITVSSTDGLCIYYTESEGELEWCPMTHELAWDWSLVPADGEDW